MPSTVDSIHAPRKALRRAVSIPCALDSESFDGSVGLSLSDLSPFGAFVETPLLLPVGDEIVVAFTPPRSTSLYVLRARVARVGMFRREADVHPVGIGLEFHDLGPSDRRALASVLVGIPPRLPPTARSHAAIDADAIRVATTITFAEELDDRTNVFEIEDELVFDGAAVSFAAAGAFVTAPRSTYVFAC